MVDVALAEGHLWPDPLLQLSPAFEPGESIDELIATGELHPETRKIFARKRDDGSIREPLRLHRHQVVCVRAETVQPLEAPSAYHDVPRRTLGSDGRIRPWAPAGPRPPR